MKRTRGGQRKPAAMRKRNNLTFRTRDGLRGKLEQAAMATGRSISEEIEYRLMVSFAHETGTSSAKSDRPKVPNALKSLTNLTKK